MSLLHEFIVHLQPTERTALQQMPLKGKPKELLDMLSAWPADEMPEKDVLKEKLQISDSFFDKISSELLARCYEMIAPEGGLTLLTELSRRSGLPKHFYKELQKQIKEIKSKPAAKQAAFYKQCLDAIILNFSIQHQDEAVLKQLAAAYIKCFKGADTEAAVCYANCKLFYAKVCRIFAGGFIEDKAGELEKELRTKIILPAKYDAELLYQYHWARLYFMFALYRFAESLPMALSTIQLLEKYKGAENEQNILRLKLKVGELYYFTSQFEKSYLQFETIFNQRGKEGIPESGYYRTKYFQVALITDHLDTAKKLMTEDKQKPGYNIKENYLLRDTISFIKYHIFSKEYDAAFDLLQLGFEKNPKAKFFQYEVELRNLEVAYFYLTGSTDVALTLCSRNIKFLRTRSHSVKNSDFPHFYLLVKAIREQQMTGKPFNAKMQAQYERYCKGSYALYGKLLTRMLQTGKSKAF